MSPVTAPQHDNNAIRVRSARVDDAAALVGIYGPYVTGSTVTFEEKVPSVEEFARRIRVTVEKYPFLVAEDVTDPQAPRIVGYTSASRFKERAAYEWSVQVSIYLAGDERGRGVGTLLYSELERILRLQNVLTMAAGITQENVSSVIFHTRRGYLPVGTFHKIGYKFGRWLDVQWMIKHLGELPTEPSAFIPFSKLELR